jgi:hypothetical protein
MIDEFKLIELNNNTFTKVSIEDYDDLNQYRWKTINGYAYTIIDNKNCYMHRKIMNDFINNGIIDHINGNKLDNTRENLRFIEEN